MKDIIGKRFGRLTVIDYSPKSGYVVCKCQCGNTKEIRATSLTKRIQPTRSCGCIHKEMCSKIGRKTISKNARKSIETNMQYRTNFHVIESGEPPINNTSGVKGVSWNKEKHKWDAYINVNKKRIYLGRFSFKEDAIAARKHAEEIYFKPLIEQKNESAEG